MDTKQGSGGWTDIYLADTNKQQATNEDPLHSTGNRACCTHSLVLRGPKWEANPRRVHVNTEPIPLCQHGGNKHNTVKQL